MELKAFSYTCVMHHFRNYYFSLALGYLLVSWLLEFSSHSGPHLGNIYTQKLIIETVVLVVNTGFLLLYMLYENNWIRIGTIITQLLAAGLYGFFTIQMLFSAITDFILLHFVLYDLFLFFNLLFFNQIVFKKSL